MAMQAVCKLRVHAIVAIYGLFRMLYKLYGMHKECYELQTTVIDGLTAAYRTYNYTTMFYWFSPFLVPRVASLPVMPGNACIVRKNTRSRRDPDVFLSHRTAFKHLLQTSAFTNIISSAWVCGYDIFSNPQQVEALTTNLPSRELYTIFCCLFRCFSVFSVAGCDN